MADDKPEIETEIDDTANKAAEIGKELGVSKDKPAEEIPDYEIEEIPDDKIAKEREPAPKKPEHKQLSNKEKRDQRKKRIAQKFDEKDAEISRLAEENRQFKAWQEQVTGRLANADKAAIDKAWTDNQSALRFAAQQYQEAFKEGDAEKSTRALNSMDEAKRNLEKIKNLNAAIAATPQPEQRQEQQRPDPAINSRKNAWEKKHSDWYNPAGGDTDSEIAKAIANVLVNEGYRANSDDVWDELDDRLAQKGVIDETDPEDEDDPAPKPAKKRTSPPVAGSSTRTSGNGKQTVSLPTAFINTLKDNGIWDDKPKRDRVIARYLADQKNMGKAN